MNSQWIFAKWIDKLKSQPLRSLWKFRQWPHRTPSSLTLELWVINLGPNSIPELTQRFWLQALIILIWPRILGTSRVKDFFNINKFSTDSETSASSHNEHRNQIYTLPQKITKQDKILKTGIQTLTTSNAGQWSLTAGKETSEPYTSNTHWWAYFQTTEWERRPQKLKHKSLA